MFNLIAYRIFMRLSEYSASVAENYDAYLGPLLFEPFAIDLAGRIREERVQMVIEIAAGTGLVTRRLASGLQPSATLVATDSSEEMLARARARIKQGNVQFRVADADQLSFADAAFDLALCGFGVMFFRNKKKAFSEVYRVLKPRGKFYFTTWGSMENNPRMLPVKKAMHEVFGGAALEILEKGPFAFNEPAEIRRLLADAGFKDTTIEWVTKTSHYKNIDDFLKGCIDGSPLGGFLLKHEVSVQEKVREKIREGLEEQSRSYAHSIPMQALVCIASKF